MNVSSHARERLKLLRDVVPPGYLGRLMYWSRKHAGKIDVAIGVVLPEPIDDPTSRNYGTTDVVAAIVRCVEGETVMTTVFLGRRTQFLGKRVRYGCATPEKHFGVDKVVLKEG